MGAYKMWGRWNPPGRNVVYASVDPSTDILEAAQVGGMTGGKNGA